MFSWLTALHAAGGWAMHAPGCPCLGLRRVSVHMREGGARRSALDARRNGRGSVEPTLFGPAAANECVVSGRALQRAERVANERAWALTAATNKSGSQGVAS